MPTKTTHKTTTGGSTSKHRKKSTTGKHIKNKEAIAEQLSQTTILSGTQTLNTSSSNTPLIIVLVVLIIVLFVVAVFVFMSVSSESKVEELQKQNVLLKEMQEFKAKVAAQENLQREAEEKKREQERAELWGKAADYAAKVLKEKQLEKYDTLINNFEKIKSHSKFKNTKYVKMADDEIAKVDKARKAAIDSILSDLRRKASELLKKKHNKQAAEVYQQYKGPFAKETETERLREAKTCLSTK